MAKLSNNINANRSISEVEYAVLGEFGRQDGTNSSQRFHQSLVHRTTERPPKLHGGEPTKVFSVRQSVRITHSEAGGFFFSDCTASSALTAESEQYCSLWQGEGREPPNGFG